MIKCGGLEEGARFELIDGLLLDMSPKSPEHENAISWLVDWLLTHLDHARYQHRVCGALTIGTSEPEPDVAVVPGSTRDYRDGHPTHAVLVVEVAESSLRRDREEKGSLYARAGIADYWIVNLVDHILEVFRDPVLEPAAPFGWRYLSVTAVGPEGSVAPLAAPGSRIPVADLLP